MGGTMFQVIGYIGTALTVLNVILLVRRARFADSKTYYGIGFFGCGMLASNNIMTGDIPSMLVNLFILILMAFGYVRILYRDRKIHTT